MATLEIRKHFSFLLLFFFLCWAGGWGGVGAAGMVCWVFLGLLITFIIFLRNES